MANSLNEIIHELMPSEEEMEVDFCYLISKEEDKRILTHSDIINENTDEYSWFMQGQQQLKSKLLGE